MNTAEGDNKLKWLVPEIPDGAEVIVVVFDICSSTLVLEALTLIGRVDLFKEFLSEFKHRLASVQRRHPFLIYKFVGDGWILLYPAGSTSGNTLLSQLSQLSKIFDERFRSLIIDHIETPIEPIGLTFGVDVGKLVKTVMYGHTEFIGRPINMACRLQSATKTINGSPAYKTVVSPTFHKRFLAGRAHGYAVADHTCAGLNLLYKEALICKVVDLLSSEAAVTVADPEFSAKRAEDSVIANEYAGVARMHRASSSRLSAREPELWLAPLEAARLLDRDLIDRFDDAEVALASALEEAVDLSKAIGDEHDGGRLDLLAARDRIVKIVSSLERELTAVTHEVEEVLEHQLRAGVTKAIGWCDHLSPQGDCLIEPEEWSTLRLDIKEGVAASPDGAKYTKVRIARAQ